MKIARTFNEPSQPRKRRHGKKEESMSLERRVRSLAKNPTTGRLVEFFGPTVEFWTSPDDEHNDFCVLKGTIPPGGAVPLHSHADTEDFFGHFRFSRGFAG